MSEGFKQYLTEDRRLAILRLLTETGGVLNESVLRSGLENIGHVAGLTCEVVRADLKFLEERGLLRQEWYGDKLVVAYISKRGVDVSKGRAVVAGVKKPSVGE